MALHPQLARRVLYAAQPAPGGGFTMTAWAPPALAIWNRPLAFSMTFGTSREALEAAETLARAGRGMVAEPVTEIDLPPLRPHLPQGVLIEPADLGGAAMWAATTHDGIGQPRRRWFADRTLALAHGADQADALGLPLLDLSGDPE